MRVLGLLLCFSNNAEAKGIKQQMLENRLKFDRDIIAHGDAEKEWDYDDWDPYLDLEDEELEALLRKMHSHMDHDDDGFVNEEELIVWSLVAIYNINGHDAAEDWEFIEHDEEKGGMRFDDVIHEMFSLRFEGDPVNRDIDVFDPNAKDQKDYNRMYYRLKARFTAADVNADELLDKAEWILFSNPIRDEAVKNTVIAESMAVVDTDKDGKLSLEEYLSDWYSKPNAISEEERKIEIDTFNEEMDRNKDGFLDENELIYWIDPENTYDAVEEAHHLLDMCDENEDEKLTAEEIIEESELWIDSVGTEYGKTLRHMDEL